MQLSVDLLPCHSTCFPWAMQSLYPPRVNAATCVCISLQLSTTPQWGQSILSDMACVTFALPAFFGIAQPSAVVVNTNCARREYKVMQKIWNASRMCRAASYNVSEVCAFSSRTPTLPSLFLSYRSHLVIHYRLLCLTPLAQTPPIHHIGLTFRRLAHPPCCHALREGNL